MKYAKIFLLFSITIFILSSCKKSYDTPIVDEDTIIESVSDLKVPASFDWKTTQTILVSVHLPQSGEIQALIITNRDGSKRYFKGFPENSSRTVNTKITIPSYENELRLIYNGTVGPNIAYISNGTLVYDLGTPTKSASSVGCDLSGFTTYSKGGWGSKAAGNNVGSLRDQYFDQVYPGDFVIGNPGGFKITFNTSENVRKYLPGGGSPAVLTRNWVNPVKVNKLGNMADQIIAARLNRDFNAAGVLGVNPTYELGELVFISGPFANVTVNDFLAMAELALGGGDMNGFSASDYATAAESIINSFHEGVNGHILTCPTNPQLDDPFVEVTSMCTSPDVIFTISNTGDGEMTAAYTYTLYKNDVEVSDGTYQLGVNQSVDIVVSGLNTDNFKLMVETPRGLTLQEVITGCGTNGGGGGGGNTDEFDGTLAFEDLWPGKGDYDFNDLVIDYQFDVVKNNQEVVERIDATFTVQAFGASYHNGFGFTLPTVLPSDIVSVTGYDVVNTTVFDIAGNGVENDQSKATIIVFDDARRVMPQTTDGIGVNTQLEYDYIEAVTIQLTIVFASNAVTFSELNIGEFNPFIIVNTLTNGTPGVRGLEVHLPNYEPSDLFDTSYFGQFDDDSSEGNGRYFVTDDNLPWAINIAEEFDWVIEFQDITGAHLMFAEWAQSGGINFPDWYQNNAGYRNSSLIYPTQIGN